VIVPLFGSGYADAGPYIGWMALGISFYAGAYLISLYLLSQEIAMGVPILSVVVVMQLFAFAAFHSSLAELTAVQVSVMGAAVMALAALAFYGQPKRMEQAVAQRTSAAL
jgi:ABC-type transport system involved in multi-copper enzyme maturation permease subunit